MKYLNGIYYVEVKDHRCKVHPTENMIIRKRDPPTSLRTQYQVQNETPIRRNQKVIKNDNDEFIVKKYPRNKNKQPNIQQQLPNFPSCKRNIWLEFDKGYYCLNCDFIINKQEHQIDKKDLRQDRDFCTRLNYASKKLREIWMYMVNTKYVSTEERVVKLQQLKGRTKLKFYKTINNYYTEMKNENFQTQQDTFGKIAQGISRIYHEVLLLMKFLQTKPQIKNMIINYYDLYYTVIKVRYEIKDIDNQYEDDYKDFITPNHYFGIKPRETILL